MTEQSKPSLPRDFLREAKYLSTNILAERLAEGYLSVAFGMGTWVDDSKLHCIFVLYHPDGRISALEDWKAFHSAFSIHSGPQENEYTLETLEELLDKYQVVLGEKIYIGDVLTTLNQLD